MAWKDPNYWRKYYKRNREAIKERIKKWKLDNPEKVKKHHKDAYTRKKGKTKPIHS